MLMLDPFNLPAPVILCIGAHCDDVEIGCGGTLAAIAEACPDATFVVWVFSGDARRREESQAAMRSLLAECDVRFSIYDQRDGYFPAAWQQIKEAMHECAGSVAPDLIFTHTLADRHQDHRTVAEITWQVFRDHLILEYEIAKYEGDLGRPNAYVPLTAAQLERKLDVLMTAFRSQHDKRWFNRDVFRSVASLRGIECNSPSGFAEAFHARKVILGSRCGA